MSELVAISFPNEQDADRVLTAVRRLQREYLIDLEDAVVAVRDAAGEVNLKQSVNLVGVAAVSGGLWGGMLGSVVGLLLLNPIVGYALGTMVGAGAGALSGRLSDYGINDDFMRSLASTLSPGTSALFVLIRKVQPEKVLQELSGFRGQVLRTSLSPQQEERLRRALSGEALVSSGAGADDARFAPESGEKPEALPG